MTKFNQRLKELRNKNKLKQSDLAKEISLTQSVISKYEKGLITPDADILNKLSTLFEVSVDYLLGNSDFYNLNVIKNEKLKEMIKDDTVVYIYLVPYKYKNRSEGFSINDNIEFNETEKEDKEFFSYVLDEMHYECQSYPNDEFECFKRIWFEIKGKTISNKIVHVGYITGYYIAMEHINENFFGFSDSNVFFEFDGISHLMMNFYETLDENQNYLNYENDFYYINNFFIDKKYYSEEIEKPLLDDLISALHEIYGYDVNALFYSAGCTEFDDDTTTDSGNNIYKRHMRNIKKIGFKLISGFEEDDIPIYALNLNDSEKNIFEDDDNKYKYMEECEEKTSGNIDDMEEVVELFEKYNISDRIAANIFKKTLDNSETNFYYPGTDKFVPISHFVPEIEKNIKKYLKDNKDEKTKVISIEDYKNNKEE